MPDQHQQPSPCVIGPYGERLTREALPPPNTKRWVIRRKAQVIAAVRGGLISLDEACRRYALSVEEFLAWERTIEDHGLKGLRLRGLQARRLHRRDAEEVPRQQGPRLASADRHGDGQ